MKPPGVLVVVTFRMSSETVPSICAPIFSRFRGARRRATCPRINQSFVIQAKLRSFHLAQPELSQRRYAGLESEQDLVAYVTRSAASATSLMITRRRVVPPASCGESVRVSCSDNTCFLGALTSFLRCKIDGESFLSNRPSNLSRLRFALHTVCSYKTGFFVKFSSRGRAFCLSHWGEKRRNTAWLTTNVTS